MPNGILTQLFTAAHQRHSASAVEWAKQDPGRFGLVLFAISPSTSHRKTTITPPRLGVAGVLSCLERHIFFTYPGGFYA